MNVMTLGPLAFATDKLAAILGIMVFLVVGSLLAARYDRRLAPWTTSAVVSGLLAARAAHVLSHIDSFMEEPWRAVYVWQGGFSWIGGLFGVAIATYFLARDARKTLPFAAISMASGLFVWFALTVLATSSEGPVAPRIALAKLEGTQTLSLADRNGRPAVVNLWATWCPPCRREMPLLAEFASQPDVDFIFANQGESAAVIRSYLKDAGLALETVLLDPFGDLSRHYRAVGMPVTLFLNPDGTVETMHFGEISREALTAALAKILPTDKE
ncbi:TlpA disulfide reductase family protein [Hoeflea sp.]|uniref:TlpA disulfide reductase family protein n=1 Tax=Hoeflea sp. TaxID=1940281 RepID=UPI0019CB234A|nr:TlpA disulfide reductase family protein [Hoeflea sp.]MBC7283270.1 TlpA family protein disulfide reductase [Hoeflea sp.]